MGFNSLADLQMGINKLNNAINKLNNRILYEDDAPDTPPKPKKPKSVRFSITVRFCTCKQLSVSYTFIKGLFVIELIR